MRFKFYLISGKWFSMVEEIHSLSVYPLIATNSFAFTLKMIIAMKGKIDMTELCVYQVKDEKIISEQFFM